MPSENLLKLHDELIAARNVIEPQIEGLKDFQRLNIAPDTKVKVTETLDRYDRRAKRINEAVAALDNLNNDDFPNMPNVEVVQAVYADLAAQVSTIGAAFAKFDSEQAKSLGVTLGDAVQK